MAEFQKVMQEWVRSRKAINENKLSCCPLEMFSDDYIANIEKEVMTWATEHPEPVYPTWAEWLYSQGLMTDVIDGKAAISCITLQAIPSLPTLRRN